MNIKFLNLKLTNFLAFGNADIALNDLGYVLVSGINNNPDDMAKSNGSGKSSLWEAVVWCLTGETVRGTKQVVNRYTTDGTSVELDFKIDNDTYKIIRYKDHKEFGTNLKIYINNIDKSGKGVRDTVKLLEQYLPDITASFLGSVIILGQGLPQRFSNNTPSGRKEVLERLSKSDFMIEDIKEKLSNRKTDLNLEIRKYEDLLLSLESKKATYVEQLSKLETSLSELTPKDWDTEITNLKKELKQIELIKYNKEEALSNAQYNVQVVNEQISKLESEFSAYQLKAANELHDKTEPIVQKKLQANFEKQQLYKEIQDAKNIRDICPTCGQKIPDVHVIDTTEMEAKYKHFDELIENYSCQIQELKAEYCKAEEVFESSQKESRNNLNTALKSYHQEITDFHAELKKLTNDITSYNTQLAKLIADKDTFEEKQITLKNSIGEVEHAIEHLIEEILYNNIERDNKRNHLEVVNKLLTIATRDFRGFLLSEIINYINTRAKEYSRIIFETDKIDFVLDGNNINISYCDKQYENLSGGEKQKVDLIIQFSIRDMLSQFLNFSSNILVADEIFDNCDSVGCQKILDMISTKLTDVESIFIVTHHENELMIPYDTRLVIIKGANGISEIYNNEKETSN